MRIKTVRRDGMNVVLCARRMARAYERDLHRHTTVLHRNLRLVRQAQAHRMRQNSGGGGGGGGSGDDDVDDNGSLSALAEELEEQLRAWRAHVRAFEALVAEIGREVKVRGCE